MTHTVVKKLVPKEAREDSGDHDTTARRARLLDGLSTPEPEHDSSSTPTTSLEADDPIDDGRLARFETHFAPDMAPMRGAAAAHGVPLEAVARAWTVIVSSPLNMVSQDEMAAAFHDDSSLMRTAVDVLLEADEVHRSKDGNYHVWYVLGSDWLAQKCSQRRISLQKYRLYTHVIEDLQEEVATYFMDRREPFHEPTETLTSIKQRYTKRIQEEFYPEKPLDPDQWSEHVAAKYVCTAKDEVMRYHALDYSDSGASPPPNAPSQQSR